MRNAVEQTIRQVVGQDAEFSVEVPDSQFGHYATNVAFSLAQKEKKSPRDIAAALIPVLKESAPEDIFESIKVAGAGFINFTLTQKALEQNANEILKKKEQYGSGNKGKGKTVIVEYSQPNVAKKMHVGHLRTTIIGDALANIHAFLGYNVIRWNYIGDWGTQFGKLIAAYKIWGNQVARLEKTKNKEITTVELLQKLYVMFHDQMKRKPELEQRGQEEFRKLEEGDEENRKLWKWFREESIQEFKHTYNILGVSFDTYIGESFFEKDMKPLIAELQKRNIAEESEGSLIIRLDTFNLPPALIRKSDGASLYLTRDIANLQYRIEKYHPERILYVVGNEQALHFEQLFAVAKLLGMNEVGLAHVKYGLVLDEGGKKFSTREGRVVLLDEVIETAIRSATDIAVKNPALSDEEKKRTARVIGIGALKYNDLSQGRLSDITFNWDRMLSLRGDSAPYLQYTYVRFRNILRKERRGVARLFGLFSRRRVIHVDKLTEEKEQAVLRELLYFSHAIQEAADRYEPHRIANYLLRLANTLNSLYESVPVLSAEKETKMSRLALIEASTTLLKSGLFLLGIDTVERM